MGTNENLNNQDAINKLKELAEAASICMFCTNLSDLPIASRPMALQEVDEEGNLWFISSAESNKNVDIRHDDHVQLFFANKGASEYLSVFGRAFIYTDRQTIEDKWSRMANAWFDGKDDPSVTIIRVSPEEVKYWDTEDGRLFSLLKIASATLTGNDQKDIGVEGKLNI